MYFNQTEDCVLCDVETLPGGLRSLNYAILQYSRKCNFTDARKKARPPCGDFHVSGCGRVINFNETGQ
jgi:hypothetical protein